MQVVFMGSPQFAVPSLRALATAFDVVGVVTQPDRPVGRGRRLKASPVRETAQALGIPTTQPAGRQDPALAKQLQAWSPQLIVVAAFGQILPPAVLDLPELGALNLHASLLPRWRGASPIQAAIRAGDEETGVTVMKMDPGLDTGPILAQSRIPILPRETSGALAERLSEVGAALLLDTIPPYATGDLRPQPQGSDGATRAPILHKEDGRLDFSLPAAELDRRVRAYEPWPGSFFEWQGRRIIVRAASVGEAVDLPNGQTSLQGGTPVVSTPAGSLRLESLQLAGKSQVPGSDFVRGFPAFAHTFIPSPAKVPHAAKGT